MNNSRPLRIGITTGDIDGVGLEIAAKALEKIRPQKGITFYLWRSIHNATNHLYRIDNRFRRITVSSWSDAFQTATKSHKEIFDIASPLPPPVWVKTAAQAAQMSHLDAIATAPLSKTTIRKAGFKEVGHTEILKKVTKKDDLFMTFVGDKFSVLLATDHIPLHRVPRVMTQVRLEKAILAAKRIRPILSSSFRRKPIAVLGINPHSGEQGLLGSEEKDILIPTIDKMKKSGTRVVGPLVPDAAFRRENWSKYAIYVCPYHDQALIPFKIVHEQESVHITAGLRFVRTSVAHGTAKDIFGKNRADPTSMIKAIQWAIQLAQDRVKLDLS